MEKSTNKSTENQVSSKKPVTGKLAADVEKLQDLTTRKNPLSEPKSKPGKTTGKQDEHDPTDENAGTPII